MYIDFNNDFIPDNFIDYGNSLNETDLIEFEGLKASLEVLIRSKYDSGMTFEEIVAEYNDSLVGDLSNDFAIYKEYGFYLLAEDLSASGQSLNYLNTGNYDIDFRDALKRIYDTYVILQSDSLDDISEYLDTEVTETAFGLHFILASKGSLFEQPSAYFDASSTEIEYTIGSENLFDIPSQNQVSLYKTIVVDMSEGGYSYVTIPDSVYLAIEYYYTPLFNNGIYTNSFLIEAAEDIVLGNSVFIQDNLENLEKVLRYYEMLLDSIYN